MSDGWICCTLREDLMREVASPPEGRFDAPLINSTGAGTPLPDPFPAWSAWTSCALLPRCH
jgi:G3E family GTPase